ncbi:MAG: hypothetical protein ACW99F_03350, partial [Candidatus Hodarchaeales archaeon]
VFVGVEPDCARYNATGTDLLGNYTSQELFCHWEVIDRKTNAGAIQQNLTEAEQATLDKIKIDKELGDYNPAVNLDYLTEYGGIPKTVPTDVIPESCKRTNPSPSDIEECNLDSKMSFCERGIQSTSPIQQYEYFAVSEYIPRDDLQIDLNSGTKPIVAKLKDYEECRAELQLIIDLNKTHYVGMAKEIEKAKVNESSLVFEQRRADNRLCKLDYSDKFKKDNGCVFEYEGTYKNLTGISAYEAKLRDQGPLAEYYKYHETDGVGYIPHWIKKHTFGINSINTSDPDIQWQFTATLED